MALSCQSTAQAEVLLALNLFVGVCPQCGAQDSHADGQSSSHSLVYQYTVRQPPQSARLPQFQFSRLLDQQTVTQCDTLSQPRCLPWVPQTLEWQDRAEHSHCHNEEILHRNLLRQITHTLNCTVEVVLQRDSGCAWDGSNRSLKVSDVMSLNGQPFMRFNVSNGRWEAETVSALAQHFLSRLNSQVDPVRRTKRFLDQECEQFMEELLRARPNDTAPDGKVRNDTQPPVTEQTEVCVGLDCAAAAAVAAAAVTAAVLVIIWFKCKKRKSPIAVILEYCRKETQLQPVASADPDPSADILQSV
ncbi:IgG receptor FcRn large subunit p51 [Amia ocellicauda]|uniref:IgG receptor FcRn large subunit p51 n=1 Tax=Amia ocellicauda TaxID=2972642 RepID=UPI0034649DE3